MLIREDLCFRGTVPLDVVPGLLWPGAPRVARPAEGLRV